MIVTYAGDIGWKMTATCDYAALDDDELSLTEGELITAIDDCRAKGKNFYGITGVFLLHHCQVAKRISLFVIHHLYRIKTNTSSGPYFVHYFLY